MNTEKSRGARPGPISCALEVQANAREVARLLEFGGELSHHQARRLSAAIVRDAVAIQRHLAPHTKLAA